MEDNLDIKTTTVGKDEEKDKEQISRDIPDVISYVQDGLIMYYDGINNTGNGHSNTTTKWKDLSGNNNDGTINGSVWEENSLNFDGIDDWVNCGEMNYSNVTIEAVVLYKNVPNEEMAVAVNWENGGYGLSLNNTKNCCEMNLNGTYNRCMANNVAKANKMYYISGPYDGSKLVINENGISTNTSISSSITTTKNSTVFALGTNPRGDIATGSFLDGKIYSVRVYNRVLTDEEVNNNYEIDKVKFGIE